MDYTYQNDIDHFSFNPAYHKLVKSFYEKTESLLDELREMIFSRPYLFDNIMSVSGVVIDKVIKHTTQPCETNTRNLIHEIADEMGLSIQIDNYPFYIYAIKLTTNYLTHNK